MPQQEITLTVNGETHQLSVDLHRTLLEVLRGQLGLTGAKHVCGTGECGACTVLVDGQPIFSCLTLAVAANGKTVTTIEGLAQGENLHPLQESFIEHSGFQCGYCTSGMILAAKSLLEANPKLTSEDVKKALSGHICRCGSYPKIIKSVIAAAERQAKND